MTIRVQQVPQVPATLVAQRDSLRQILRDRIEADVAALRQGLRAAWREALDEAQRKLPAELFPQIPGAHDMPDDFDGKTCELSFTFAGHYEIRTHFTASESGARWTWQAYRYPPTTTYDPLDIRGATVWYVARPYPCVCPDLASALDAAEIGGGAVVISDDDGGY